jgi:DNA-binding MarR family transcriptional regulator
LARDLDVTPGNVTGIVDRMVEQGLVSRKPDPEDRRVVWLAATEKGRELLSNLFEADTQCSIRILEHMSLEDLKAFARGLSGFLNAVDQIQKESSNIVSVKE